MVPKSSRAAKQQPKNADRGVRMLTPEEIESLQRDKEEAIAWLMKEYRKSPRLLTPEELENLK